MSKRLRSKRKSALNNRKDLCGTYIAEEPFLNKSRETCWIAGTTVFINLNASQDNDFYKYRLSYSLPNGFFNGGNHVGSEEWLKEEVLPILKKIKKKG